MKLRRNGNWPGESAVYDSDAFEYRVSFAASVILSGRHTTRNFDTCFEMYDGHEVAEALRRRAERNPKLAASIWRYISKELTEDGMAELAHLNRKQLADAARRSRAEGEQRSAEPLAKLIG